MPSLLIKREQIPFDKALKQKLSEVLTVDELKMAERNSRSIIAERILYKSNGHNVVGFIVRPKATGVYPCIISNRGGTGEFGAIKLGQVFWSLARMAQWGYFVIASQYSGNAGGEGYDEFGGADLDDVLNLQKIILESPTADASKIGMFGASRGGMMTYMSLAKVKWIKAAVTVAGVSNLPRNAKLRSEMKENFKERFGGSAAELKKRSAIFWPEKFSRKVPILLMHGTADWRVSPLDSLDLANAFYKHQVPHRLVMFEGADHSLNEFRDERETMTKQWFDRYLKADGPLPKLKPHGE